MNTLLSRFKHRSNVPPREERRIVHRLLSDPFLDWALILGIAAIAAAALVATGVSVYLATNDRLEAPPPASAPETPSFDASALSSVLSDFDARASIWSDHAAGYQVSSDPSLP